MKPSDVLAVVQQLHEAWPVPLVMGFCEQESGRHDRAGNLIDFNERAFLMDRNGGSYGLMQIDVPTARDRGFKGVPNDLYDPPINISWGLKQLDWIAKYLRQRASLGLQGLIAAYNEGVGNVIKGNPDPLYVGNVLRFRERWRIDLGEGVS